MAAKSGARLKPFLRSRGRDAAFQFQVAAQHKHKGH
jgi:hypothetical protein